MTSDERHEITDLADRPADSDGAVPEANGGAAWDLDWEPAGRMFAPKADGPAPGARYVELPIRAAAFALDAVLLIVISDYAFRAVSAFVFSGILTPQSGQGAESSFLYLVILVTLLAIVAVQAAVVTYLVRVFRATPGQMAFGLFTLSSRKGHALPGSAAFVRWLLLFAPLPMLAVGPLVIVVLSQSLAFDGRPTPDWFPLVSTLTQLAPVAWFVVLIVSVLLDERGRGLHDYLSASVVVRREGPPA